MSGIDKNLVLQIFTGGYTEEGREPETVTDVLLPVLDSAHVEKIIMGWSVAEDTYLRVIELAGRYGTEVFLWLPVLSETGLLAPVKKLTGTNGPVKSFHLKKGENFEFYCPNQPQNLRSVKEIYEKYFEKIPFDGVFLDKIRYASFSNGIDGVFSCFCPECLKEYEKAGTDTGLLIKEMEKVRRGDDGYRDIPLGIRSYEDGTYHFKNEIWGSFFSVRQKAISKSVGQLADEFKKRGLKTGIDTFSPFIAYFAGQDIKTLGKKAGFVKPMMYRLTHAPAGLLWETECLLKETLFEDWQSKAASFFNIIKYGVTDDGIVDISFAVRQLEELTRADIDVYPGIEVNRIRKIAEAGPEYIRESLLRFSELPVKGFVLSWDLLSAPTENIKTAVSLFR